MVKIGDKVLIIATHEAGTVHRIDPMGSARLYWLAMAAREGSRAPIDLGGPFTSDELRADPPRR